MENIRSVLIVEDSIVQRQHLALLLQYMGIGNVYEATNGAEALTWLGQQAECPDILFCDLSMPVMDGVSMLQVVAERGYKSGVVILSGREENVLSTVAQMTKVSGLNYVGTITKPPQREHILKVLSGYRRDSTASARKAFAASPSFSVEEIAEGIRQKQMVCHFQPKILMSSGKLKGVEALVRWQHPVQGLLYPGAFIPQIESTPVIQELTLAVLEQVIRCVHDWKERGMPGDIFVNVNVSADSLANPHFVQLIADRFVQDTVKPERIVLEVTESAIVRNLAQTLATVAKLRLMGFGLSIDDYGTGYSSMQQIAQLPFTELKLDRSLVDGVAGNPTLQTLCGSAIDMAHKLGFAVVAEGMENKEDFEKLRDMGCDLAQGYYIAKPMPAEAIVTWR